MGTPLTADVPKNQIGEITVGELECIHKVWGLVLEEFNNSIYLDNGF